MGLKVVNRIICGLIVTLMVVILSFSETHAQEGGSVAYSVGFLYGINTSFTSELAALNETWSGYTYAPPVGLSVRLMNRRGVNSRVGIAIDGVVSTFQQQEKDQWLFIAQLRPVFSMQQFATRDYRGFFVKLDMGVVLSYAESNTPLDVSLSYYPSLGFEVGLAIPLAYRLSLDPFVKLSVDYANDVLLNPSAGVAISF